MSKKLYIPNIYNYILVPKLQKGLKIILKILPSSNRIRKSKMIKIGKLKNGALNYKHICGLLYKAL